jgi:hypothetical protein
MEYLIDKWLHPVVDLPVSAPVSIGSTLLFAASAATMAYVVNAALNSLDYSRPVVQ